MATKLALTTIERNDDEFRVTATKAGQPIDLASLDIEAVIKDTTSDDDSTGTVLTLAGGDMEIVNAAGGVFDWYVPAAAVSAPGKMVYHVDVLDGGKRHTVLYGELTVVDI